LETALFTIIIGRMSRVVEKDIHFAEPQLWSIGDVTEDLQRDAR
jgi:hypothetical protein